jgi:hypothetical protein
MCTATWSRLQAEEILKGEGEPDRLAIHQTARVYAKRRDTKGFELLALSCTR